MVTIPGLSVALRYLTWFAKLIEDGQLGADDVESRQPMMAEVMRPGYSPTPEMLEAVRRSLGVFYPKIDVVSVFRIEVNPTQEVGEPHIGLELAMSGVLPDHYQLEVKIVLVTGGLTTTIAAYLEELRFRGYETIGEINASAYLRSVHGGERELPPDRTYYSGDNWIVSEAGDVGITSDSARGFNVSHSYFLVTRQTALVQ